MLANAPVVAILPIVNMDAARRFYEGKLGLRAEQVTEAFIIYLCGNNTRLLLYQRGTPTVADHTAAGWAVEDIVATVRALAAGGVTFEQYDFPGLKTDADGIAELPGELAAWLKDPEGNILSIFQLTE